MDELALLWTRQGKRVKVFGRTPNKRIYDLLKEGQKVKILKNILNWFLFLLTGKGELADEMIEQDLISYEGQGRNKYGK